MSEIRRVIRELLVEELGRLGKSVSPDVLTNQPEQEVVAIRSSADLCGFAGRVLALARNPEIAHQIEQGKYPFRLCANSNQPVAESQQRPDPAHIGNIHFAKGIVTEKDVASLDSDVRHVSCSTSVCLTPLARDALRRRGITIVRNSP